MTLGTNHSTARGMVGAPTTDRLTQQITVTLGRLRRASGASLVFSGRILPAAVLLDRFDGPVVGPLRGARLDLGSGLGGRVAAGGRALAVSDYMAASGISHQYDAIIRAESLGAMAAAPVVVARKPVAVLYAALRSSQGELGRLLDMVTTEARRLEQDIAVGDTIHRLREPEGTGDVRADRVRQARARDAYARLRELASDVEDPVVRARILTAAELLTDPALGDVGVVTPHLTERELDVLALLSSGLSDRAISDRLGISVHTVKGHMKSLLGKLAADGRLEVVANARRLGLTP
ncbi:response regulator transcription factor [Rhodococcoides yunnanense]|uniref:LuxR C-terminal-related transcriptional regulator n=1 Tax=Rhodococcoides yunnanense TaxID=278209 RepID=A0ABU4BID8_9NOCA|nr:LuxR C-terminal-related transcriptional regulator [Rhodococcus yunnanensis]MDV6263977.1 LuxR C-terminal-related transcriptional regulator [Rhodococcus yunnanensis]